MLNSRRLTARLPRIIGALLLVLVGGCSGVRLGYDNAPTLAYWWLDSYVDFTDSQSVQVRDGLVTLQAWHRRNELPAYAELLRQVQRLASGPVTPQQVCAISNQIRTRVQSLSEQLAEGMSRVVPTLTPAQLRHLAQQFDKHNQSWREEWLDIPPAELAAKRLEKAVERAENFYGRLEEVQLAVLRQRIAVSTFDAPLSWRERLRRQQDMLQLFAEHGRNDRRAHVKAEVLALLRRSWDASPDPVYRRQFERLLGESCETLAAVHNSTSPRQRAHAIGRLQGYEEDLRALASQTP